MSNFIYYEKLQDYEEQVRKAKEYDKLQQEIQRKDNIINDLKSSIADYQEAVGDYQDEIVRKNNNWNELKKYLEIYNKNEVIKLVLDKMKELENDK